MSISASEAEPELIRDGVVRAERRGDILVITLNRPEARNAVNYELSRALGELVDELTADDGLRAAVLTGAGKAFCAGQDLKALAAGETLLLSDHPEWGFGGFVRHFTPKPIIAAVHGFAFGGGLELALACDLIVAADDARLGFPEVTRGLFAAAGGVPRIAQHIPLKIAMQMVLTGQPLTAGQAAELGLVNQVVPEAHLLPAALSMAATIAANGPLGVQASKRLLYETAYSSAWDAGTWTEIERETDRVFGSEDAKEGATAFIEKRPPIWRNR
jgi:enoyl-CoA hydratase/carnithine racemase